MTDPLSQDVSAPEERAWGSGLSVDEFVLLRGVGFEPVGQVMGCSVQYLGPRARSFVHCGYDRKSWWKSEVLLSGEDNPADLSAYIKALYQTRRTAMAKLAADCAALGADGVVAVSLHIGRFLKIDRSFEFRVTGTAVQARGPVRPARPFMSSLSGQDFVKLVASGWIPVDLVLGAAVGIRHGAYPGLRAWDGQTVRRERIGVQRPQEINGWSELVRQTRHEARKHFEEDAAGTGAEGVLLSSADLRVRERPCQVSASGQKDDVAEATLIGTAIVSFRRGRRLPEALPILRL